MKRIALTGNEALALGMKQVNPDVVAAYPITPQTEVVQLFSQFIADGELTTDFVTVESEHSAMSATVGAAAAGARAMTATSANGLALMIEVVYIAASGRLPIVMPVINRALSAPINIHCDHSDAMLARDSGWIQLFSTNSQEAYDNIIQGVKIAEDERVRLPVMVNMDGFIISHAVEDISPLTDQEIRGFIGDYTPETTLLDPEHPVTFGPLDLQDYYFEHKRQQVEAMDQALEVIPRVGREFGELTDRFYEFFMPYQLEDARVMLVGMGSTMGTARAAVDRLREQGRKVGLLGLRLYRPFPAGELHKLVLNLKNLKVIGVMDRATDFSRNGGPLYTDIHSALADTASELQFVNYIYGLGGRDIMVSELVAIYEQLLGAAGGEQTVEQINYWGVRQ